MRIGYFKPAALSWLAVSLMAVACCVLAVLQYRWITDFSAAQRDRLHQDLQGRLNLLARTFNEEISSAGSALVPPARQIEESGRQTSYAARYEVWKQTHQPLFRRISLAVPEDRDIVLWNLDLETSEFQPAAWPVEWSAEHARLLARTNREMEPFDRQSPPMIELPRFGNPREEPRHPQEWLLAELNLDFLNATFLPELLNRYVSDGGKLNYDFDLVSTADPSVIVYQSAANHSPIGPAADA